VNKTPISVITFGGINKLHTRQPGEISTGKNFYTSNNSLYTRDGLAALSGTPFVSPVRSIHSAGKVQVTTRMLVEEGANLWHSIDLLTSWEKIKSNVGGNGYSSTTWSIPQGDAFAILVSGSQGLVYDIAAGTLSNLINNDGDVPNFEFVTTWRGFVWGWAPNWPNSNLIRFCGYDTDERISIDYWPLDFAINPSRDASEPILAAHPMGSHMVILTPKGYYRIYGYSEDNFEVTPAGEAGLYGTRLSCVVGSTLFWLGADKRVYIYSGTSAYSISQPIDEFLQNEPELSFSNIWSFSYRNQFWLVLPNVTTNTTKIYIFDLNEKAWFIYGYTDITLKCGCILGNYLDAGSIYFGLHDNRIAKVTGDADFGIPVLTEFVLGPFYIDSRKFKLKRIYFNAEPRRDFTLNVSTVLDQDDEVEQGEVEFEVGGQVAKDLKISGVKGQNISLKVSTTDKINELQGATLVIVPKNLK